MSRTSTAGVPRRLLAGLASRRWLAAAAVALFAGSMLLADEPAPRKKTTRPKKSAAAASRTDPTDTSPQGPSTDHPQRVLALWSSGPTTEWRTQAYGLAVKAEKLLNELEPRTQRAKPRFADIGRAHVMVMQLDRLIKRLQTWGEPASLDLDRRRSELQKKLSDLVGAVRDSEMATIQANLPKFQLKCKKQLPALELIKRLADDGKPEEAEQRLLKIYDQLSVEGVWYPSLNPGAPLSPYEGAGIDLSKAVVPERKRVADEAINAARQRPDYVPLLDEVVQATSAVGRTGQCKVAGAAVAGPKALAAFLSRWQELHLQGIRAQAIDWAAQAQTWDPRLQADSGTIKAEQALAQALVKFIDADGGRAADEELRPLYLAYQQALAPTLSLAGDDELRGPFQAALDRLTRKSPAFQAEVDAYRLATSDLLRWRSRVAEALAAQAAKKQPAATPDFKSVIDMPVPKKIAALSTGLVGKSAVARGLIGSADSERSVGAVDRQNVYYVVPLDARLRSADAWLRAGLLAENSLEPLSLEAAIALATTARGDLVEVGGTIRELELQALIPLFAHVGQTDWGLVRLDQWPELSGRSMPIEQLRVRATLQPRWYRQPFAFVEVAENQAPQSAAVDRNAAR